jgi:hypothetical protein
MTFRYFGKGKNYLLRTNGRVEHFNGHTTPDYLFSDTIDINELGMSTKMTLLVSSDDNTHYKEWKMKIYEAGERGFIKYMPVFSGDELKLVLRNVGLSEEESEFRFTIVGGSIRHALGGGDLTSNYDFGTFVESESNGYFGE